MQWWEGKLYLRELVPIEGKRFYESLAAHETRIYGNSDPILAHASASFDNKRIAPNPDFVVDAAHRGRYYKMPAQYLPDAFPWKDYHVSTNELFNLCLITRSNSLILELFFSFSYIFSFSVKIYFLTFPWNFSMINIY